MKAFIIILLFAPIVALGQSAPKDLAKKIGPNSLIYSDSVQIAFDSIRKINPSTITLITVITDSTAIKRFGDEGKNNVLFLTTKEFGRKKYTSFFRKVSNQYDSLLLITKSDTSFQYIINNKPLKRGFEGNLFLINDDEFISLEIITAEDLKTKYNITDRQYGILIKSHRPKDVSSTDNNF